MEVPYTVHPRPDTGLSNPKLGIWLFLASEVMLFGGLFACYIFMRLGSPEGYWPVGWLNVPVGAFNTAVLIVSSVTVILAFAALKARKYEIYWWNMLITIVCGTLFLGIKLSVEWPEKFHHFGVYLKDEPQILAKYEHLLGNNFLNEENKKRQEKGHELLPKRLHIAGHLAGGHGGHGSDAAKPAGAHGAADAHHAADSKVFEFEELDSINGRPNDGENLKPTFIPRAKVPASEFEKATGKKAVVEKADVEHHSFYTPKHNTYLATYFMITGLHGLHVLAGVICFIYFFITGKKMYRTNPDQLANRVEVSGLFWHFVDLVWIFVFPIFYLL